MRALTIAAISLVLVIGADAGSTAENPNRTNPGHELVMKTNKLHKP